MEMDQRKSVVVTAAIVLAVIAAAVVMYWLTKPSTEVAEVTPTPFQHEAIIATPSPSPVVLVATPSPEVAAAMNGEAVDASAATGTSDWLVAGVIGMIVIGGFGLLGVKMAG